MLFRILNLGCLILGMLAVQSCGSSDDDTDGVSQGGGVGASCTETSQCAGYNNPTCATELKPLDKLVVSTEPNAQAFKDLTLPFPGGYCSTTVEAPCAADADCGSSGSCFLAFEGVSQAVIDGLGNLGLPFDIHAFANLGVCLQPCAADTECRSAEGYKCTIPIKAFMDVINPQYTKQYCFQDVDVSYLLL